MCFQRLDLFYPVLDETGSPVSTFDNIHSLKCFYCSHQTKIWLQNLQILSRKTYLPYSGPLVQVTQVCQEIPGTIIIKNERMTCIKCAFIHPLRPPMIFCLKSDTAMQFKSISNYATPYKTVFTYALRKSNTHETAW